MRKHFAGFLIAAVLASTASGQSSTDRGVDRTLHFSHAQTAQEMQEIATAVRSITDIQQAAADTERKLLAVHGSANQVALAEWLFDQLDQPANRPPGPDPDEHKYLVSGADPGNVVRVFYLTHAETTQKLQELATIVRSTGDIRRLFTYAAPRAMVARGTADQIALAEWLVNNLDTPAKVANPVERKYLMPPGKDRDNVVRVFYLVHTETVQNLQEVATLVRSISDIRRLFVYTSPRAIATRGTPEQIGLAEWLVNELDQPANAATSGKREYSVPGPGDPDNVVRVFSLTHAGTAQRLQEIAVQVRTMTQVRRLFTYNESRIIALRGTPGQVEQADQMIRERDR